MKVKIVSFATPGAYEEEMQGLKASASEFNLKVHSKTLLSDSWQEAVRSKPKFILSEYFDLDLEYDGLLWVDADARFVNVPDLEILKNLDAAWLRFRWSRGHELEFLTGTMYFARNPNALILLESWIEELKAPVYGHCDTPEQRALKRVVEVGRYDSKMKLGELPRSWVWITPEFDTIYPTDRAVIRHMQASRRLKQR